MPPQKGESDEQRREIKTSRQFASDLCPSAPKPGRLRNRVIVERAELRILCAGTQSYCTCCVQTQGRLHIQVTRRGCVGD